MKQVIPNIDHRQSLVTPCLLDLYLILTAMVSSHEDEDQLCYGPRTIDFTVNGIIHLKGPGTIECIRGN